VAVNTDLNLPCNWAE